MTRTQTPGLRTVSRPVQKPASNVYTVLLLLAFLFIAAAVAYNIYDLVQRYGVEWSKALWPF